MKKPIRYLLFSRIAFVTAVVITIGVISESVLSQQDNAGAAEETKRESPEKRVYIRLHESEEGAPLALQTNIVSFKGTKGPYKKVTVDLIGAIQLVTSLTTRHSTQDSQNTKQCCMNWLHQKVHAYLKGGIRRGVVCIPFPVSKMA